MKFLDFEIIKRILRTDIVKVFSFTSVSTLVRMLTGLISVKVVAAIIGPPGVALMGQLNNFINITLSLSSGGINNGVTKYVSEFKRENYLVRDYISTALRIIGFCTLIISLGSIFFSQFLSNIILKNPDYSYIFIIFGITIFLYSLNNLITAILNGFKEFKKYVKINIANSIFGLLFTLALVIPFGLNGALISAVTYQSIALVITFWMSRKLMWFKWDYFKNKIDIVILRKYFKYSLMSLTTAAIAPVSQLLLRGYVISDISIVEAGWWEGMNRISNMYLTVITTSFSVYYLPRLSEINDKNILHREILKSYATIIPILLISTILIFYFRIYIIKILYTTEFMPMQKLFIWQLIGDFFKISSWILSFIMIAKALTKMFISTEIIFGFSFIALGFLFLKIEGVVGICQAYLVNYFIYFVTMLFIFRKLIFMKIK